MIKLKVHLTDKKRTLTSKGGKEFTLIEGYVFLPDSPYPQKLDFFDEGLASGMYVVPSSFEIYNGRLQVRLDFKAASPFSDNK